MINYLALIAFISLIANVIVSLVLGHSANFYNPNIKSTYSGFDGAVLGIFMLIMLSTIRKYDYPRKLLYLIAVLLLVFGVLGIGFQFALGFYLGGWACIMWLAISFIMMIGIKKELFEKPINERQNSPKNIPLNENGVSLNSVDQPEQKNGSQALGFQPKTNGCCNRQKCGFCWHGCCLTTVLVLMGLFVFVSIAYFAKLSQYPVYGNLFQISLQSGETFNIQAYCIGNEQVTRPTMVLEHGGGSNSMAFTELGFRMSEKGWKVCSYDRLGYGRSSVIDRRLTIQKRAQVTDKIISKLLVNHTNKEVIIGGWSAGVELSQIYRKQYPLHVRGMIFFDGYPNYLALMSIYDNKSQVIQNNVGGITGLVRALEPFGLGFVVGNSQISNQTARNYYQAYYQTGYFWESQYFDSSDLMATTNWLTQAAQSDPKPYPDARINLNWPSIDVPLLVLPANGTVSSGSYSQMYLKQAQKYIDKCSNVNKRLTIMKGDHGFVLAYPAEVANELDTFFRPLF